MDSKHKMRCIRSGLRHACDELSSRGLYLASKWAAEQLYGMIGSDNSGKGDDNGHPSADGGSIGMPSCNFDSDEEQEGENVYDDGLDWDSRDPWSCNRYNYDSAAPHALTEPELMTRKEKDYIHFAQSLIMNGEYLRCAHMLRQGQQRDRSVSMSTGNAESVGSDNNISTNGKHNDDPVTPSSSSSHSTRKSNYIKSNNNIFATNTKLRSKHGIFLATYSLYMAGEKLKNQQQVVCASFFYLSIKVIKHRRILMLCRRMRRT